MTFPYLWWPLQIWSVSIFTTLRECARSRAPRWRCSSSPISTPIIRPPSKSPSRNDAPYCQSSRRWIALDPSIWTLLDCHWQSCPNLEYERLQRCIDLYPFPFCCLFHPAISASKLVRNYATPLSRVWTEWCNKRFWWRMVLYTFTPTNTYCDRLLSPTLIFLLCTSSFIIVSPIHPLFRPFPFDHTFIQAISSSMGAH